MSTSTRGVRRSLPPTNQLKACSALAAHSGLLLTRNAAVHAEIAAAASLLMGQADEGTPVALLMIDVDHFKRFNDTHGHAAGDVALKAVATALQEATRQSDIVVRYGGEEFVALLPDLHPAAATERAEMLRQLIEGMPIGLPRRSEVARVSISVGVAAYGYDGTQAEDLLDRADARLFEAKAGGRNRVVGPPPESEAFVLERRATGDHGSSAQSVAK